MTALQAARVDDPIAHTASKSWMIVGLIGGAILGAATVATGGLALVVASAAVGACAAGGLGEVLGSMSWAPRHVTGMLTEGSPNVYVNSRKAIRAHLSLGKCDEHSGSPKRVAEGSIKIYINNYPAARLGDKLTCSAEIFAGSPNVFFGGMKVQTDEISPEIPGWVNWVMLGVGTAALAVVATPAIAVLSTAGAFTGGTVGNWVGGWLFGEGSDGQKWSMLFGSMIGGGAGMKGGAKFDAMRAARFDETNGVPISKEKFDEIIATPKNERPLPETYLPAKYIDNHLSEFSNGASRIVPRDAYDAYGVGKPDQWASEFVGSKDGISKTIQETAGNTQEMAKQLGISKEQLESGELLRIDFFPGDKYKIVIPSGNEFGANSQWLPGGRLPTGKPEVVIWTKGMVKGVDYEVYDLATGAIYE